MKRLLSITALTLFVSLTALAQDDAPKSEVFGGYSYIRTEGGGGLHGWNGSAGANLNKWFGLFADFSGHYSSSSISATNTVFGIPDFSARSDVDVNFHTVLVGPRFSYRKHERLTPFAHALFGASRLHVEGSAVFTTPPAGTTAVTFSESEIGFAMGLGGGLDVKLTRSVALRLIQADYFLTRIGGNNQNNARLAVGFVYRFGTD
jgi:opacity protein-like surface antigen